MRPSRVAAAPSLTSDGKDEEDEVVDHLKHEDVSVREETNLVRRDDRSEQQRDSGEDVQVEHELAVRLQDEAVCPF